MKRFTGKAAHALALSVATSLLLAAAPKESRAQSIELVYASGWPREHVQVGVVADEWFRRIESATAGRVKFRHVAGGTLLKPEATLDGVRKRIADCGPWVTSYKPGALPITTTLMGALDVELGNQLDIKGITAISAKLFEEFPAFRKEFETLGVRGMLWVPTAPYAIISKKPTKSLTDLNGQKLRGFGKVLPKFQEAMGVVPVAVANAEMYTSIQTGVIDGAMTDPGQMVTAKLFEVARYVLMTGPGMGTNLAGASVVYICNEKSWQSIAEADRRKITEVTAGMAGYISKIMQETADTALQSLRSKGITVSHLSPAELNSLKEKAPLFDMAAKELDAQGLPGTAMAKRYRELAADYRSGKWKP